MPPAVVYIVLLTWRSLIVVAGGIFMGIFAATFLVAGHYGFDRAGAWSIFSRLAFLYATRFILVVLAVVVPIVLLSDSVGNKKRKIN